MFTVLHFTLYATGADLGEGFCGCCSTPFVSVNDMQGAAVAHFHAIFVVLTVNISSSRLLVAWEQSCMLDSMVQHEKKDDSWPCPYLNREPLRAVRKAHAFFIANFYAQWLNSNEYYSLINLKIPSALRAHFLYHPLYKFCRSAPAQWSMQITITITMIIVLVVIVLVNNSNSIIIIVKFESCACQNVCL